MKIITLLLAASFFIKQSDSKISLYISETFEDCASPEERADLADWSNFEIIAMSDTEAYANGTVKLLKPIRSPWKAFVFLEQHIRGEWVQQGIQRTVADTCLVLSNPTEVAYHYTQKYMQPNMCPVEASTILHVNMWPLHGSPYVFTPNMLGDWRITFIGYTDDKKECRRGYAAVVDV